MTQALPRSTTASPRDPIVERARGRHEPPVQLRGGGPGAETIKTLASISYFVIADVTNPKSSPLELQATVPDYQIPFIPIIQEGEYPFAMMIDLQKKYNWVLDTLTYNSIEALTNALKPVIIDPAIEKYDELKLIKAGKPGNRTARYFLHK